MNTIADQALSEMEAKLIQRRKDVESEVLEAIERYFTVMEELEWEWVNLFYTHDQAEIIKSLTEHNVTLTKENAELRREIEKFEMV